MRFGLIGSGNISHQFIEACKATTATPYALFSRTEKSATAFSLKHPTLLTTTSLEEFFSIDFDAVYIASPNICHAEQAMMALSYGKHVLCEKPIASTEAEYQAMADASKDNNAVLLEAMRPVHDPAFRKIKENISRLGPLRRVHLEFCQYSSRYDSYKKGTVLNAFSQNLSNASLMDIGVYPVAVLMMLFGMPNYLTSSSIFLDNGFEGAGELICQYNDMLATLSYSKITDSVTPSVITGEYGSILIDKLSTPKKITLIWRDGTEEDLSLPYTENNMCFEIASFINLVQEKKVEHPFHSISLQTMRMLDKIREMSGISFA